MFGLSFVERMEVVQRIDWVTVSYRIAVLHFRYFHFADLSTGWKFDAGLAGFAGFAGITGFRRTVVTGLADRRSIEKVQDYWFDTS